VWNGEIYNHADLRRNLEERGARFETRSDTEVLLAAYAEWGRECLPRLNGMWGLAIYDHTDHSLFLARDRFGIKPLYFTQAGGDVFAASELKALFPFGLPMRVAPERMVPGPGTAAIQESGSTIYEDVWEVPAGTSIEFSASGRKVRNRWWSLADACVAVPSRFEERAERFRELLEDSLRLRVTNDVPTAVALSGGVDSSSLYGACQEMRSQGRTPTSLGSNDPKSLRAFTAHYPGSDCDESEYAMACAAHWRDPDGVEKVDLDAGGFAQRIEEVVWHQEVPVWSPAVAGYHAFYERVAAAGPRVIVEGHGADEMLGGYENLIESAFRDHIRNRRWLDGLLALRAHAGAARASVGRRVRRRFEARPGSPPSLLSDAIPEWRHLHPSPGSDFSKMLEFAVSVHPLPMFLRVFDRATMAHGLESTPPFLDHRLVEFAFSLPASDKVRGQSKRILRRAARDWLPPSVANRRRKQGFSVPLVDWFNSPHTRVYLEDFFRSSAASTSAWGGSSRVLRLLDSRRGGKLDSADLAALWPVLNLQLWEKLYGGPALAPPSRMPNRPRPVSSM